MSDLFLGLTYDWVLRAVEAAGFEPTGHIMALHCMENRVYDLKLEDGQHVIAKFYRPGRWGADAIREEHQFLLELQAAELPVCAPLIFEDGDTLHEVEGIWYAVWPRTGGRAPDELTDEQVAILGRLVARIHNVGAIKTAAHRPELNAVTYGDEAFQFLEDKGFIPPQYVDRYGEAVDRVAEVYESLAEKVPLIRVHGDCHHGNLLNGREGWFFLDFDDFRMGPAVQDVWLLVPDQDELGRHQRDVFIEAYNQFRTFEPRWLKLVEPLRALRYVHYAAWIARRWKDPAFPPAFPHFNSETYWEKETHDLEQQADRCERIAEGADE